MNGHRKPFRIPRVLRAIKIGQFLVSVCESNLYPNFEHFLVDFVLPLFSYWWIAKPRSEMEPKRKKLKKQERDEEIDDLDRLSALPDCILIHIVSFLDTSTMIKASVLSKRFKLLWTFSQRLDFKLPVFRSGSSKPYGCGSALAHNSSVAFESYVNHVLQRRVHSDLNTFRLSLHKDVSLEFLQNCIDYAAQHKVEHLKLRAYAKRNPVRLPEMLITSTTLVSLSLNNAINHCIELPKTVVLPKLKVLRLKKFEFFDGNFGGDFFTGCLNLETLVLNKCYIRPRNEMKVLDVNCLNLKNLEIRYWRSPWRCFHEHMITVSAPNLEYFFYKGHVARVIFRVGLIHLEKACIDLCYPTACIAANVSERKENTSKVFLWMLREINTVTTLSLSFSTIEVLSGITDLGERLHTIFENLRFLKFTSGNKVGKVKEMAMHIGTITRSLGSIGSGMLGFHGSKVLTLSPVCSVVNCKSRDVRHFTIPTALLKLLLERCPSAEFLSIVLPKDRSHQE